MNEPLRFERVDERSDLAAREQRLRGRRRRAKGNHVARVLRGGSIEGKLPAQDHPPGPSDRHAIVGSRRGEKELAAPRSVPGSHANERREPLARLAPDREPDLRIRIEPQDLIPLRKGRPDARDDVFEHFGRALDRLVAHRPSRSVARTSPG